MGVVWRNVSFVPESTANLSPILQQAVMAAKYAFTPLLCCQLTWAIYEDSRQFFFMHLLPDDFKPGTPMPFPFCS
jgi:hypothetical protein